MTSRMCRLDQTGNYLFSDPSQYPVDKNNFSPRLGGSLDARRCRDGGRARRMGPVLPEDGVFELHAARRGRRDLQLVHGAVSRPTTSTQAPPPAVCRPSPCLVNGPIVNRALLNSLYPASSTQRNTGTVNFDNPDRHLPYSRQASIGFEKQLPGNIAVSADYIHSNYRDLYMRQDLNPGLRDTTGRTATADGASIRPDSSAACSSSSTLGGPTTTRCRRASTNASAITTSSASRTRGRAADGIVAAAGATDTINTQTVDPATKAVSLNLDNLEAAVGSGSSAHPVDRRIASRCRTPEGSV